MARIAEPQIQQKILACLEAAMKEAAERCRRATGFGLAAAGEAAETTLLSILRSEAPWHSEEDEAPVRSQASRTGPAAKYALWALGEIGTVSPEAARALLASSSGNGQRHKESSKEHLARATATAALGLMAQHAARAGDMQRALFRKICEHLIATAMPSDDELAPPEDLVREEAALSLLLACVAAPEWAAELPGTLPLLKLLTSLAESDRYVMAYAAEALLRLAEAGHGEAEAYLKSWLGVARDGVGEVSLQHMVRRRRCPHSDPPNPPF